MTVSTQKRTEIANRRQEVSERYLRGMYMADIAAELGVDTATVSRDLAELRKEWLERSINHIDQRKAIELAKLDRLELEYWDAWQRSQEDAETITQEKLGAIKDTEGKVMGTRVKEIKKREGQSGNPAFLAGILNCINKRCEILGLNAPKDFDFTSKGEKIKFVNFGVDNAGDGDA